LIHSPAARSRLFVERVDRWFCLLAAFLGLISESEWHLGTNEAASPKGHQDKRRPQNRVAETVTARKRRIAIYGETGIAQVSQ
jgi:hypothetical protein